MKKSTENSDCIGHDIDKGVGTGNQQRIQIALGTGNQQPQKLDYVFFSTGIHTINNSLTWNPPFKTVFRPPTMTDATVSPEC